MPKVFKSRKFWASVVALGLALFGNRAGLDDQTVQNSVLTIVAYILGTGLEGFRKA